MFFSATHDKACNVLASDARTTDTLISWISKHHQPTLASHFLSVCGLTSADCFSPCSVAVVQLGKTLKLLFWFLQKSFIHATLQPVPPRTWSRLSFKNISFGTTTSNHKPKKLLSLCLPTLLLVPTSQIIHHTTTPHTPFSFYLMPITLCTSNLYFHPNGAYQNFSLGH